MMTVHLTCPNCGSAINIYPTLDAKNAECPICSHGVEVHFDQDHEAGELKVCPHCQRKDFYSQKDFNRKIGVALFVLASILAIFTYGISFIVLYIFDFLLFKKLATVAICYNCQAIFRKVKNIAEITGYNHEMNDRIVYSGQDFQGQKLNH